MALKEQDLTDSARAANAARQIVARLAEWSFDSEDAAGLDRPFMGPAMAAAADRLTGWMQSAGLSVRRDGFGNIIGRLQGASDDTILLGSHFDTVPNAGWYDGQLGILVALEAAAALAQSQPLPLSVEVVAFSEEEGVRFGFPFIGSKGFLGKLPSELLDRTDAEGVSVRQALLRMSCDATTAGRGPWRYVGYHEVHLEQGPVLEAAGKSLGIVDAIAGQIRLEASVTGRAGHAGTTPMALRSDALVAAARMILAVREAGLATPGLVATVGRLQNAPNATNVIPGDVTFTIDIRHSQDDVLANASERLLGRLCELAAGEKVTLGVRELSRQPAVPCAPDLMARIRAAVPGAPVLTSGAGHDGLALHPEIPISMSFVRCRAGLSHHPDEFVAEDDIAQAVLMLNAFLESYRSPFSGVS